MGKKEKHPESFWSMQEFANYVGISRMHLHRLKKRFPYPHGKPELYFYKDFKAWLQEVVALSGRINWKTREIIRNM